MPRVDMQDNFLKIMRVVDGVVGVVLPLHFSI
jgi:hypothetical protein